MNHLRFEVFFQEEDLNYMMELAKELSKEMRENTDIFNALNEFVFNSDWKKMLKRNKKLARKLLDAIKLYQRPGIELEK